ncbi:hypothetical protein AVEN_73429-1 [Araneus ventricosus]|uniref:Uncharacterized protein n=1 Tax=Araneus ventricosus TaxID=182803 RepID=A0A4Y2PYY0_ARAVE|nr:hypothetical protein AVEN_73429-1 [Araneus ventricosus]
MLSQWNLKSGCPKPFTSLEVKPADLQCCRESQHTTFDLIKWTLPIQSVKLLERKRGVGHEYLKKESRVNDHGRSPEVDVGEGAGYGGFES